MARLKEMAKDQGSIFINEEKQVALNQSNWHSPYPERPHELSGGGAFTAALKRC